LGGIFSRKISGIFPQTQWDFPAKSAGLSRKISGTFPQNQQDFPEITAEKCSC
jgi:hypothetical protein